MKLGIAVFVLIMTFNITVGAWSVDKILSWFGKDIPIVADALIGLFTAEFSVPIAIVGSILKACGIF